MSHPQQPYPSQEETFAAFGRHVSPGKVATYQRYGLTVVMGEREGIRFRDAFDGRWLINCHCNGGVFNLGHRSPPVLAAVRGALDALDIGNHHLVSGFRARLAERLAATTGGHLPGVCFGVSGGEAIDLAIKLARAHTGRQGIVSASGGYHGTTGLSMAAGDAQYREPFGPNLPGFSQVPFDDVGAMDEVVGDGTAAVILEPVPATLGMPIAAEGYLAAVERICHDRGALLIMDEVQTGLGRTGTMWCYTQEDLRPDLLVTGKGLSGGVYPITATLMTGDVLRFFEAHPFAHISTFGGAEVGCAAALAVLDVLEGPGFLPRVHELGERFERGLSGSCFTLRRRGLMMGLAFPVPDAGLAAAKGMLDAGVFAVYANNDTSVLQLLPPLITRDDEADDIIARVRGVFG